MTGPTRRGAEEALAALAGVLAVHRATYTECAADPTTTFYCEPCSEAEGEWVTATPVHQAERILASSWLQRHDAAVAAEARREAAQDAWDRGYASGYSNAARRMSDEPNAPTTPNPYRHEAGEQDG